MSLNWDLRDVKDEACWIKVRTDEEGSTEKRMHPITEGIIFLTLAVDMGEITEKNHEEFFLRLRMWETCRGCLLTRDTPVTLKEVRDRIGLRVNVNTTTMSAFKRKLAEVVERAARDDLDRGRVHDG